MSQKGRQPMKSFYTSGDVSPKHKKICGRSKKWWDSELGEQLKVVRKAGRGGKGQGAKDHDPSRWMRWKKEKAKMKVMVQKKKEECWRKFTEEYGERDPWEVARLARDPWRLKLSMRNLNDKDGNLLEEDETKAEALAKQHFRWE